jgi:hypothetical protein
LLFDGLSNLKHLPLFLKTLLLIVSLLISLGMTSGTAQALTVTVTGIGSGSLGGTSFTNAAFTILAEADQSDVSVIGDGYRVDNSTTSIDIAGLGVATLGDSLAEEDVTNPSGPDNFAIADFTVGNAILVSTNPSFASYDFSSSLGPVTGSTSLSPAAIFGTNLGGLTLTSSGNTTVTVDAPEPAFLFLAALPCSLALIRFRSRLSGI